MTAPSGIGVNNYNWYMKNVHLVPYTWGSIAEGLATGMEELAMYAGLMDEKPRAREDEIKELWSLMTSGEKNFRITLL